jgi:hypothetical protein
MHKKSAIIGKRQQVVQVVLIDYSDEDEEVKINV